MNVKIGWVWITLAALVICLWHVTVFAATNELSTLLSKGLFEEEANHNLPAAIQVYQVVTERFDTDRKLAATAVFRLGECYRKQGNTNEALTQYQRVLSEFADQLPLASLSRQYVASLAGPIRTETELSHASSPASPSGGFDAEELSQIQATIRNSPDLINAPDRSGQTLLQTYAGKGNLEVVKLLLDKGAAANGTRQPDLTPLHFAAGNGHKAAVDLLLGRGAKADVKTDAGVTPLHLAVWQGYELVARDLLDAGAPVNAATSRDSSRDAQSLSYALRGGQTPLHLACIKGYQRLVEDLVAKGADVNAEDGDGRTSLGLAVQAHNVVMAKALLAAHADPNKGRASALYLAASDGDAPMVQLLLSNGGDPNACQPRPLEIAVLNKHPEIIQELLRHKADPSVESGGSPLIFAALSHEPTLQALLDGGVSPNATDAAGESPLSRVLKYNNSAFEQRLIVNKQAEPSMINLVNMLLSHGADPNAVGPGGDTPLNVAVEHGKPAAIEPLLNKGARINAQREDGRTPLHLAIEYFKPEIVAALLDHGADPNVRDNAGETPLDVVKRQSPPTGPRPGIPALPNRPPQTVSSKLQSMEELLLAHGASDDLPRMDRIEVRRTPNYVSTVFTRYTNDVNRFTVLELLAAHYRLVNGSPAPAPSPVYHPVPGMFAFISLPFPDLDKVLIRRPEPSGKGWRSIPVSVQAILDSGDCSRDVWLKWGDQVEIPEADHPLGAPWSGLSMGVLKNLENCIMRRVRVTVRSETTDVILRSSANGSPGQFTLVPALQNSGLLRASSDLSRVKVIRHNSATEENWERTYDCSVDAPYPSLWLRDGDAIDVPDKP